MLKKSQRRRKKWTILGVAHAYQHMIQPTFQPGDSQVFSFICFFFLCFCQTGEIRANLAVMVSRMMIYCVSNCLNCSLHNSHTHLAPAELFRARLTWSADPRRGLSLNWKARRLPDPSNLLIIYTGPRTTTINVCHRHLTVPYCHGRVFLTTRTWGVRCLTCMRPVTFTVPHSAAQ